MKSNFRVRFAWYVVAAVVAGLLPYMVAPLLSPFLFAAIPACICLPLVDRLAKGLPRDRMGLHPLAVTFALLVFGHLFGFFGVLLALPASAALFAGSRRLRRQLLASELY